MLAADPNAISLRRKVVEENEMDITPMIDITFLLLIFFVLTAKVSEESKVPLPTAKYGAMLSAKDAVVLSVVNLEGELPIVFKGDQTQEKNRILATTAIEQDESISEYVEEEFGKHPEKQAVLIQADKALKSREVQRIARAACRTENVKLYYKVDEEK